MRVAVHQHAEAVITSDVQNSTNANQTLRCPSGTQTSYCREQQQAQDRTESAYQQNEKRDASADHTENESDLRAFSCVVGRANTLLEQLYLSRAAE